MWRLFYNALLLALSPVIVAVLLAKRRCRRGLPQRLGLENSLSGLSGPSRRPDKPDKPVIWVHAVSLGEVVAVTPLVIELHRRHPECRRHGTFFGTGGRGGAARPQSALEAYLKSCWNH